jgi:hypothetical protein
MLYSLFPQEAIAEAWGSQTIVNCVLVSSRVLLLSRASRVHPVAIVSETYRACTAATHQHQWRGSSDP